jgi:curved DNA-binding protein CbpA
MDNFNPNASDPYEVLGVAFGSGAEEIKRAYFALVREHPPERDPVAFKRIRAAYELLNSPEKLLSAEMLRMQPWTGPALAPPPPLDLSIRPEDVIAAARAFSDLVRRDWRKDFREAKP